MLSLTIHHNIHLTKQQRYELHEGKDVAVVGVSIPVWCINKTTSEPAKEVFCKYYLKNPKQEVPIKILTDGFEISLPYRKGSNLEISNEEWRNLASTDPAKLDQMYGQLVPEVSSKNLLDTNEGGSEFLQYRELNQMPFRDKSQKTINIMHYVVIASMESLENSLD